MKNTLAAVLLCSASAPLTAQDFMPFGDVAGSVSLTGDYCYVCPNTDGSLETNTAFVLGLSDELQLDTKAEAPIGEFGTGPNLGVILAAKWAQRTDVEPLWDRYNDDQPPPWWETEAHEWEFELSAGETDWMRGSINIQIELELTEWTELSMRAVTNHSSHGSFTAEIGGLEASESHSISGPFGGDLGTLAPDGMYHRSVTLGPGQYHLSIIRSHFGTRYGDTRAFDARVQLRFEKGVCPGDLNGDGILDNGDIIMYVTMFLAGC
jgi:hypothetical protein